ncbi:TetR family transcriptional regulator [Murinocardiopsis flavida]|uniref:TetR family transcriptional regulator n=1 Tax=Murinocardiopsis flavida TaxID=645275 RepID=A0A2P8CR94_9ACTN|nr:TetR/AcrR family transcriptional regulator [Murinocardiopsis flavida]PSK87479.1 TetR family transcriptional regulator [Murinocardiopsis flavida]
MNAKNSRDGLLTEAIDYYADHGVRDTSLRTLAAAIGTSQRMLHYHFGDRGDLLAAVITEVVAREIAALEAMSAEERDPFDALGRHWARVRATARKFGPLYFELSTHAMYGAPYAVRLPEVLVTRYAAVFAQTYATVTDAEHSSRLARLTLGVGRGLLFDVLLDDDLDAADAAVAEFTAMVRHRIAHRRDHGT